MKIVGGKSGIAQIQVRDGRCRCRDAYAAKQGWDREARLRVALLARGRPAFAREFILGGKGISSIRGSGFLLARVLLSSIVIVVFCLAIALFLGFF